jgi:hypothetical protein
MTGLAELALLVLVVILLIETPAAVGGRPDSARRNSDAPFSVCFGLYPVIVPTSDGHKLVYLQLMQDLVDHRGILTFALLSSWSRCQP